MKLFLSILLLYFSSYCFGQALPQIDSLIQNNLRKNNIAALAIAIIDSGKVVHISANGFRDIKSKSNATVHTPFHIASVSKTVTLLAIFNLVESEKIDLDTDISDYLSFKVINPHFPNDKITVRGLLNHRSGIKDNYAIYEPFWTNPKGDPTIPLKDFMKEYLSVDGNLYKKEHFESDSTFNSFNYSNTGFALLGLVVESVSGMPFNKYCEEKIFKPVNMNNTGWFLKNLDTNQVAKTYIYNDSLGMHFKGHNGYPDYPAGQLRTSISDYSKLMVKYLNAENENFILKKETISRITPSPETAHEGFFTWFLRAINNTIYYFHTGGDTGARAMAILDVDKKRGIIIFANSEYDIRTLVKSIEMEMWSK